MNICVALERRKWLPVEQWEHGLLGRFCEDCAIRQMASQKIKVYCWVYHAIMLICSAEIEGLWFINTFCIP